MENALAFMFVGLSIWKKDSSKLSWPSEALTPY